MKQAIYQVVGLREDGSRMVRTRQGLQRAQSTKNWMLKNSHNDPFGGPRKIVHVYWKKLTDPQRERLNVIEHAEAMI